MSQLVDMGDVFDLGAAVIAARQWRRIASARSRSARISELASTPGGPYAASVAWAFWTSRSGETGFTM